jgi:hypothetical protein
MLLFGIVSQIASEFNLAKRAADSLAIATTCAVYETRMESVLNQDDPGAGVVNMLVELSERFESEQFNRVLPSDDEDDPKCRDRNLKADARAKKLISSYGQFWNLRVLDNRGVSAPRKPSASQPTEEGSDPLAE